MGKCVIGRYEGFGFTLQSEDGTDLPISICDLKATDTIIIKTSTPGLDTSKAIYHICHEHWIGLKEQYDHMEDHGYETFCSRCGVKHKNQSIRYRFRRGIH